MSIKAYVIFTLQFIGDGSSRTFTANIQQAPFVFKSTGTLPDGFPKQMPSAVDSLSCSSVNVTGSVSNFTVTFSFDNAPSAGLNSVSGRLIF